MPETNAKWLSKFLNEDPGTDIWLSLRRIQDYTDNGLNTTFYKYFTDFTCKNFESIKNDFERNHVMIRQVNASYNFEENYSFKSKRSNDRDYSNLRERIVGKYVSYGSIVKWMFNLRNRHPNLVKI